LPGLGGFLVWELKENWKLYRANQSPTLEPEVVGHHGETVLRLMKPGLHSGTLPKLYAKLRRTKGRSARRQREALHGVKECLHHFVERDLLAILHTSKAWAGAPLLEIGAIQLATNRIRVELCAAENPGASTFLELEDLGGWLLGGLASTSGARASWLTRLTPPQALVFRDALAGFYKLAGVVLVREQLEAALPPGCTYEVTDDGIVVWPSDGVGPFLYALRPREASADGKVTAAGPGSPGAAERMRFDAIQVKWPVWSSTWQQDHDAGEHTPVVPLDIRLLPTSLPG
jgi:hypothetical protein